MTASACQSHLLDRPDQVNLQSSRCYHARDLPRPSAELFAQPNFKYFEAPINRLLSFTFECVRIPKFTKLAIPITKHLVPSIHP